MNGLMTTTNDGPKARGRRDRDGDDDGDDDDDLEARLERLERKLEQLSGSSPRSPRATMVTPRSDPDGRQIAREYHLPSGKLEALLALMSREDVPVKVQGGGDKIIVHATHQQHEIFEAFVHLIDPEGRVSPAPRAAVRSFSVGRSGGHTPRPGEAVSDTLKKQIEEINREREKVQREAEKIRAKAETLRSKADGMKDEAARSDLRRQAQELARQAREMARQAREMQRHARDSLRERTQSRANDDGDDDDDEVADRAPRADHDGGREHPGASADANLGAEAYAAGYQLHTQGQYDKAIELFKKSAEAGNNKGASLYNIACGYARKGEKDKAFEYLAKAWAAGYRDADHMRQDDDLDNIRNDKRFGEIVAQAKDKDDDDDDGDNN